MPGDETSRSYDEGIDFLDRRIHPLLGVDELVERDATGRCVKEHAQDGALARAGHLDRHEIESMLARERLERLYQPVFPVHLLSPYKQRKRGKSHFLLDFSDLTAA